MATAHSNKPFTDYLNDQSILGTVENPGFINGGVLDNSVLNPVWTDNALGLPSRTDLTIPEGSKVRIGDFIMTGKEFKVCMKMLQKMAMKECPEEFI